MSGGYRVTCRCSDGTGFVREFRSNGHALRFVLRRMRTDDVSWTITRQNPAADCALAPPFSPDLDLIGDLEAGQRAAWEDPR